MSEHTPTPWTWIKSNNSNLVHIETDTDHAQIASMNAGSLQQREDNADFVVRACNSHQDMRDALETLVEECADGNLVFRGYVEKTTLDKARAALKSAGGAA